MLRFFLIFFFSVLIFSANAKNKEKIIKNLKNTSNLSFQFEQNINGKIENGNCIIEYPKKIFCEYKKNNKVMVSNGKSLVIKTISSYYLYPLKKTPLNLILDKNFLIEKILVSESQSNSLNNYSLKIIQEKSTIIVHFDKKNLNLIGWTTNDIYQNKVETKISNIKSNLIIDKKIFKIQNYIN